MLADVAIVCAALEMKCRVVGTTSLTTIKMLKIEDGDADATALRACAAMEIQILQQLPHPNVVTYIEVSVLLPVCSTCHL